MDVYSPYIERVEKVLQHICINLDRELKLSELSRVAAFSEFHFHRIFQGIMDETLAQYVSRKRMELGASQLAYSEHKSITEIAFDCGFSSAANFSKAIKQYYGLSPKQIRDGDVENSKIGKLKSKYGKEFNPLDLYSESKKEILLNQDAGSMEVGIMMEVIEKDEIIVATLRSPNGYVHESVKKTWVELLNATKNHLKPKIGYALCYDNPFVVPYEKAKYEASIPIEGAFNAITPLSEKIIPKGTYARTHYSGNVEGLLETYRKIYSDWFPRSGYEPDHFPAIEEYTLGECIETKVEEEMLDLDILIKVKPLS